MCQFSRMSFHQIHERARDALKCEFDKGFLNASKYCGSVLKNDFVVVVLVLVVLSNFYQIFKESDYFETCRKWKFVVCADKNKSV